MSFPPAAEILILADDEATARRRAAALRGTGTRVWLAAEDVPDLARLELVVADREAPLDLLARNAEESAGQLDEAGATRPGVIRVGGEGPADLRLPADATDRELRLACRLLAEIVRLRRKDHAAAQTQRRLAAEALTDPLTGLPNRRAWERALEERVHSAGGATGRLCLAVLDLDHFKRVNDAHGHAAGDEVLRAAGKVISGGLRQTDFVARLGGDEFGLLLTVRDDAMARAVVDRVRRSLPPGLARHGTHQVTASAGYHVTPSRETAPPLPSPDAFFIAADTALGEAKRQGRDRTVASLAD
ncbi:MAG TPA: GGDEF domain-containing protein [Thermoguttaceae bacterium]|nr:GGDEF domain-containing protein [Thermoguttaceae bacterium]